MTDVAVPATPPVPQSGGATALVGHVTHYFSQLEVVAVRVDGGRTIYTGDVLQFGDGRKRFRIRVISMERDRATITESAGPDHVGIETGRRAAVDDPVYVVSEA